MTDLATYYRERAAEYDLVYAKPERQGDLATLRSLLQDLVENATVLEVAAGTGYWTTALSATARSVVATDVNDETLRIARTRTYGPADVDFRVADAFDLDDVPGEFDTVVAGFFWSHLTHADTSRFAQAVRDRIGPGGRFVVFDNRYVDGSNYPISRIDDDGNTYQARQLSDGRTFEVLKNFPDHQNVSADVAAVAANLRWTELDYFWLADITLR